MIRWLRRSLRKASAPAGSSHAQITYALPSVRVFRKYYNKDTRFDQVDWTNWGAVTDGFRSRFVDWYFEPLAAFPSTGHEAYPVLCAMCALVDTFTHYDGAAAWHEPRHYKEFLRKLDPVFRNELANPIEITRLNGGSWTKGAKLIDFADVFYTGVRCSLHHHGDLASFAGMSGTGTLARELTGAGTSTCGKPYSLVVFDPWCFREALRVWFEDYCRDLRADPNGARARMFRAQFERDFAIVIPGP